MNWLKTNWFLIKFYIGLLLFIFLIVMAVRGCTIMIRDGANAIDKAVNPETSSGQEIISTIYMGNFISSEKTGYSFRYRADENMVYTNKAQLKAIGSITAIIGERINLITYSNGIQELHFETSKTILINN